MKNKEPIEITYQYCGEGHEENYQRVLEFLTKTFREHYEEITEREKLEEIIVD